MSTDKIPGATTPMSDEILEKVNSTPTPEPEDATALPQKPASAYIVVSMLCMFVAFGGFVFGWDTGTISGFVNMTDFTTRFGQINSEGVAYFSPVRVGLIISIFNIGCAIGGIFLSKFGQVYGRRVGLMITMLVYIVGIVIQISSVSAWYQFFIGRIISGLAVGSVSVLCPLFIAETSPKHIRGTLVSCYQLMITMGIFLGYCTTYGTKSYENSVQWRVPLGLCFLWAFLMITGMVFMPESPRFLVQKGRLDDARASLGKVNKVSPEDPSVYAEVEAINAAIEMEASAGKAGWGELFTGKPKIFFRLITGMLIQSLQQLTGNNYFFYYGTTIFNAVGMKDSFQTSIILGIVNFGSTFVALWAVEKFGRRMNLMIGSVGTTICFVIFATLGVTALYPQGRGHPEVSNNAAGNGMIFVACLYIFFFATTWAPTTFVVCSEIYPIRIKEKGMAMASACNWIWGFLISFFTPFITKAIGFAYGYVFMGCLIFSFFFVYVCVPETKGLSLEEVDELYASGVMPWKSVGWKPSHKFEQAAALNKAQAALVEHADVASSSSEV